MRPQPTRLAALDVAAINSRRREISKIYPWQGCISPRRPVAPPKLAYPKADTRDRPLLAACRLSLAWQPFDETLLHYEELTRPNVTSGGSELSRASTRTDVAGRRLRVLLVGPSLIYLTATLLVWWHPYARRSGTSMAVGAAMSIGASTEAMITAVAIFLLVFRCDLRTRSNYIALTLGCVVALSFWMPALESISLP